MYTERGFFGWNDLFVFLLIPLNYYIQLCIPVRSFLLVFFPFLGACLLSIYLDSYQSNTPSCLMLKH